MSKQQQDKQRNNASVTIYLYYAGTYVMKYENLTREEADRLLRKWNSAQYPGWLAKEQ
jgi:hypothetical protein